MKRRSEIVRRVAIMCVLLFALGENAQAAGGVLIQFITDGGGSAFGQLCQLAADGSRRSSNDEILEANRNLSLMYLTYYPATLNQKGAIENYARTFFGHEWSKVQSSPEYRNPIKRPVLLAQWRARIEALPKIHEPTISLLVPVLLQKSKYQTETASVPVRFALKDEMIVSSGESNLRCIKVDKEFSLNLRTKWRRI